MSAIAALPPSELLTLNSYLYTNRWADVSCAQSNEGRQLFEKVKEVCRYLRERPEVLLMAREETDEFSYEHAPANRVFFVRTKYVYLGKGRPQPFDLDDE